MANDPLLGVSGDGRADIALLNAMGFQASAIGNHELDLGSAVFASIIAPEVAEVAEVAEGGAYPGAAFPYLAANLRLTDDEALRPLVAGDGLTAPFAPGSLAGSAVVSVGDERIGVVGTTTPHLARITSVGGITVEPTGGDDLDALAALIQRAVDELLGQGIDKVILLAHMQQIAVEEALAGLLSGVDVIVAGGSNTILADAGDRLRPGDEAEGPYPLRLTSATGKPLLLVNTDADYRYLGRLVVGFDEHGVVLPESVDASVSGAYATDAGGVRAVAGDSIDAVSRIVESLRAVLRVRHGNIIGRTSVYLAGRRGEVRTQETNLGNLTADANLWLARQADPEVAVSFKNAGGIRDHIGLVVQPSGTTQPADVVFLPSPANSDAGKREGDISQFNVEGVLRFNNGVAIDPLTARRFVEVVEHAIGFDGPGEVTHGRFPQVGGMRFSFDPSAPAGRRVRSLAVVDEGGAVTDRVVEDGMLVGDPEREIKVATLNFLANGGDGYPFPLPAAGRIDLAGEAVQPNAPSPDFPDTNGNGVIDGPVSAEPGLAGFAAPGTEQHALAGYLAHCFAETPFDVADVAPREDLRIQNLGVPGVRDTVFDTPTGQ